MLFSTPALEAYLATCSKPATQLVSATRSSHGAAPAPGVVVSVTPNRVEVKHCLFENHVVKEFRTAFEGRLKSLVSVGDVVEAGHPVVSGASIEARVDGLEPQAFARSHSDLWHPHAEPVLVLVDVETHVAIRLEYGRVTHQWEVAHGQREGVKERQGDLRTPRGLYFVVERSRGPFVGPVAEYFGGMWVKLNYPNAFDAERGKADGLISTGEARRIAERWRQKKITLQRTRLGGGIGFHGWAFPWSGAEGGYARSWGCVVLHPEDTKEFYEHVPLGTPVVLL